MSEFLKLSDAATIGIHAMMYLAGHPGRLVPQKEIAEIMKVSEAHLAKVLQRLGKAGLVKGTRGPTGGYVLQGKPADIQLLEVFEAIDGPIKPRNCLFDHPVCKKDCCGIGPVLGDMNRNLADYLRTTHLSDVSHHFSGKMEAK